MSVPSFENLSVGSKLIVLVILPVIGMLFFAGAEISLKEEISSEMKHLEPITELAVHSSNLVHELQKERGMSAGFIGSKGEKFAVKLPQQRKTTDKQLSNLNDFINAFKLDEYPVEVRHDIDLAKSMLARLGEERRKVSSFNLTVPEAVVYYTKINSSLLNITTLVPRLSSNGEISALASAYVNFLQAKERAGVERAVMAGVFSSDRFAPGIFEKFISLVIAQETYINVFKSFANDEQLSAYENLSGKQVFSAVNNMRVTAKKNVDTGSFGIDSGQWFNTISKKINALKDFEDKLAGDLKSRATVLRDEATNSLIFIGFLVFIVIVLVFFSAWLISRVIKNPIQNMQEMISAIEKNSDLTQRLNITSTDEVGKAAQALDRMLTKFEAILQQIRLSSTSLSDSSQAMMTITEQTKVGVDQQQNETTQVATAMNEMSATAQEVANSAIRASEASETAENETKAGLDVVKTTMTGITTLAEEIDRASVVITKLGEHSDSIGQVLDVIRGIAEQTNLLALNAAIEAARAGEHGRGFAVVADEVRTLAQRTQESTQEIDTMISHLQGTVQEAVTVMDASHALAQTSVEKAAIAGESLNAISQSVATILDINIQVASAAEEQSAVSTEIDRNIQTITMICQQTAEGTSESSRSGQEVSVLASQLNELVGQFKVS